MTMDARGQLGAQRQLCRMTEHEFLKGMGATFVLNHWDQG